VPISPTPLSLTQLRYLLFLAVAASFYLNLWGVPLFDLDEGAFSEATREMFIRGDFISTYLDGVPRYDKPILIYWLQAASVWLLGVNEFAFRLPSALAASLWVWAVFAFTRRVRDERNGLVAAIITATAFEVSVMGRAATADALLNLFIAGSMFCVFLFWRERRRRWLLTGFALMGLGFLTKGPVAVLIPLAVSFLFFAVKRELKAWLRMAFDPAGLGIFLLIALPWYVVEYLRQGDAFIQGFFFKHNINRFTSPMEQHGGGILYYPLVVLVGVLPYTSLLIKTLARFRPLLKDDLGLFGLLWFLFVIGFFTLSGTKLPHYVLYGLTGLFVLMAGVLPELRARLWSLLPALVLFTLWLLLPEIIGGLLPGINNAFLQEALAGYAAHFSTGYRLFFVAAIMLTILCMGERRFQLGDKLLASGVVAVLGLSLWVLPVIGEIHQGPLKAAALLAKREGLTVVRWRIHMPSFSVYRQQVTPERRPAPGEVVLTKSEHLAQLKKYEVLYRQGGVALVRVLAD
jgi:4-amino-4-deoxy-L-arabinose transferase-like glycosyltransferase